MSFAQFDLSNMVRCTETNAEGFRCRQPPNHHGEHTWDRCEWVDDRGARCMLPHRHPAGHALFWYDQAVAVGTRRTLVFRGTEQAATALANRAGALAAPRGWTEVERRYGLDLAWRLGPMGAFLRLFADPQGSSRVTFERVREGAE